MGVPSLNDLAVDGTLNTTNQPTKSALSLTCGDDTLVCLSDDMFVFI